MLNSGEGGKYKTSMTLAPFTGVNSFYENKGGNLDVPNKADNHATKISAK